MYKRANSALLPQIRQYPAASSCDVPNLRGIAANLETPCVPRLLTRLPCLVLARPQWTSPGRNLQSDKYLIGLCKRHSFSPLHPGGGEYSSQAVAAEPGASSLAAA